MAGEPTRPPNTPNIRELESLRIARSDQPRRRSPIIPILVALAVTAVVAGVGYFAWTKTLGRPPEVQTAIVMIRRAGQPGIILTGSGYIVTKDKYITIGAQVLGQIVEEPIQEGQHVKKGQLLAKIDGRDYVAQLNQALADHRLAQANVELATAQARRQRKLFAEGVISKDQLDTINNTLAVDEAALKKAEAAIAYARFNVGQCYIRSPINGIVLKKYREVGSMISYGNAVASNEGMTDIAQLANTENMRAEVDINESDIAKVVIGAPAQVVLDAYPDRPFNAKVVQIYAEADRQKGTVKVEVHILKPDLRIIKPEMSAKVTFLAHPETDHHEPLVLVPQKAVQSESGRSYVWVVREGHAYRANVSLGRNFQDGVQVLQGLTGGEMVIVVPPAHLREGEEVNPVSA